MKRILILLAIMVGFMSDVEAQDLDKENLLYLDLDVQPEPGDDVARVVIAMRPDKAPKHVARIRELAREGFYDGLIFHRVIDGFMAQGGDPLGNGIGGSGQNLEAEFSTLPHVRGTASMARAGDPNSADSQFFICLNRVASLDQEYTVWGRVIQGMEYVDRIPSGEPPANPAKMVSVRVGTEALKK